MSEETSFSWLLALAGWLILGTVIALVLRRMGEPAGTSLAAVPAWPLFLPLLSQTRLPTTAYRQRIERAFVTLEQAFRDAQESPPLDLGSLKSILLHADQRLLRVEAMIEEERDGGESLIAPLLQARSHARGEIEAVLAELGRIRIQIGLVSLSNNAAPIREALQELAARVRTLEELH